MDPNTPSKFVPEDEYVTMDLLDLMDRSIIKNKLSELMVDEMQIVVLLGDYGSGKSMTMRDAYFQLRSLYHKNETSRFPMYLNLRDHIGQDDPGSAIYDHGGKIGFTNPEQLVRAWRAGFVHIFLDGFDEVSSSRFRSGVKGLREVRRRAMVLVRKFVEQHPLQSAGLMISGRQNYFGSVSEGIQAMGMQDRKVKILTLNEFTNEQALLYLKRLVATSDKLPEWLPFRPLLIGYLATRGLFKTNVAWLNTTSRAESWDYLLDRICEREGRQIDDLGGQTDQVRDYVDRLATKARVTSSGRGPISILDMTEIFRQVFPASPDEAVQQLLIRLAGVTGASETPSAMTAAAVDMEDSREFVDEDLVDVARAGDVVRFVKHPFDDVLNTILSDKNILVGMGDLGIEVAAFRLTGVSAGQISAALMYAADELFAPYLAWEIVCIAQHLKVQLSFGQRRGRPIVIEGAFFHNVTLSNDIDLSNVVFKDCIISHLDFDGPVNKGPSFEGCLVQEVTGIVSRKDVSADIFAESTEISSFSNEIDTNSDVRRLPLHEAVRVLVISLRKLYLQAGGGRKENAFSRGLDDAERPFVPDVLSEISSAGFATPSRGVWVANKLKRTEALSIIEAPQQLNNALIEAVKRL